MTKSEHERSRDQLMQHPLCVVCLNADVVTPATIIRCEGERLLSVCSDHLDGGGTSFSLRG